MQYLLTSPVVSSFFLAVTVDGRWQPGIGDPTPMGWITTLSYGLVAIIAFYGVWHTLRSPHPRLGRRAVAFWLFTGMLMLLLAVNKQLDLQSLLTQTGRDWSRATGWYGARRDLQAWFVWVLAGLGGAGLLRLGWSLRGAQPAYYLALVGLMFTGCFVIIRASSFHHVDSLLGYQVAGIQMNWILELGGTFVVGVSTLAALALQPPDDDALSNAKSTSMPEPEPEPLKPASPSSKREAGNGDAPTPEARVPATSEEASVEKSETVDQGDFPDPTGEGEEGEEGEDDGDDDLPDIIILDS